MELDAYQLQAVRTEQKPKVLGGAEVLPFLGLAGETGELLNEYKKYLRDGSAHERFRDRLKEELGDLLWYLADAASKFELRLSDVATFNLRKVSERWGDHRQNDQLTLYGQSRVFDAAFPPAERLPRRFVAEFYQRMQGERMHVRVAVDGQQMGQELDDNVNDEDGYRFHDVFHLACAAVLGWSPVTRRNLNRKRRSVDAADRNEDGGRAIVTEEGISALVFAYALDHARMEGVGWLDYDLLKAIKTMTAKFEVAICTTGEWEKAILLAYSIWRLVEKHAGGNVVVDLDRRDLAFTPPQPR
ncbi:MAG: nucleoside triphosphate pyrophosphohydrolase family protein [Planctomycetota bacterium]|nr:nucleoside triphosphate pyrophosphohydrolase family protein [Planctomycetota bacterium]